MPSFADIKAKAVKAKDVSVAKIQTTKDRNTSIAMKKTNWDPYSKQPPPPLPPPRVVANTRPAPSFPPPPSRTSSLPPPSRPPSLPARLPAPTLSPSPAPAMPPRPPPRSQSSSTQSPGPPPVVRTTRPDLPSRVSSEYKEPAIDWANLSSEDKDVLFSWLDEFFGRYLNIEISPRESSSTYR